LLNIGSPPRKQGKFPVNGRENQQKISNFAVLDLALARIVNGADCWPPLSIKAATMGP
jgi:hypothetical protein